MENTQEIISDEDKTLSLFCHLSVLIGGILVPIIIWAIKKNKSKFVRFHSLQSIFFHLTYAVVVSLVIILFAVIVIIAGMGISSVKTLHHTCGMSFALMVIAFSFLVIIILSAFGIIAYSIYLAVKTYNGEKIRIPVLGKIIYERVYGKE
jgi:uncharacterized protein